MKRAFIWLFALAGVFFGVVWWFDVHEAGGSFSDFFSDPVGGTKSLGSRLWLWGQGLVEQVKGASGVAAADPRALAASLIAGFEGFAPKAYADPPGQTQTYSIGYGHQIRPGDGFDTTSTISEGDALALLESNLDTVVNCVENVVQPEIAPEQRAALYSLAYNIGCAAFQSSSLLKALNEGNYDEAAAQFAVWNKANHVELPALDARRAKEAALFSSVPYPGASDTSADTSEA